MAGRKRKEGARTPYGQLSRAKNIGIYHPAEVRRLADAAIAGVADKRYATPLGRLYLAGELNSEQYAAGERWDRLAHCYHRAMAGPWPHPKSANLPVASDLIEAQKSRRRNDDDLEFDADADDAEIIQERGDAGSALRCLDLREAVLSAIVNVCELHQSPVGYQELLDLRRGLNALVIRWNK